MINVLLRLPTMYHTPKLKNTVQLNKRPIIVISIYSQIIITVQLANYNHRSNVSSSK